MTLQLQMFNREEMQGYSRPFQRSDCEPDGFNSCRPCAFVSCRYSLLFDIVDMDSDTGEESGDPELKCKFVINSQARRPDKPIGTWSSHEMAIALESLAYTCALDAAAENPGGLTQVETAFAMGLCEDSIANDESTALRRLLISNQFKAYQ